MNITFREAVLTFLVTVVLLVFGILCARAEDAGYDPSHRRWRGTQADGAFHEGGHIAGTPRYRYAGSRRHHHRRTEPEIVVEPVTPIYGYLAPPAPASVLCKTHREHWRRGQPYIVEGRSNEHHSADAALADAKRDWRGGVRNKFGETHAELDRAQFVQHQCVQSSVNQTVAGRVGEATGLGVLYRCSFWGQPCEVPIVYEKGEQR